MKIVSGLNFTSYHNLLKNRYFTDGFIGLIKLTYLKASLAFQFSDFIVIDLGGTKVS